MEERMYDCIKEHKHPESGYDYWHPEARIHVPEGYDGLKEIFENIPILTDAKKRDIEREVKLIREIGMYVLETNPDMGQDVARGVSHVIYLKIGDSF